MPPATMPTKAPEAPSSEKPPLIAASTANLKQTNPEASLSSASPERICRRRRGAPLPSSMEPTATASVGDSTAASAKQAASGTPGSSQWMNQPPASVLNSTSPRARARITPRNARNDRIGIR